MIELIEVAQAPDGNRTIWKMLVDAGASTEHILFRDPCEHDESMLPAALQFRVDTSKLKGFLIIVDNPFDRCFGIKVQPDEGASKLFGRVFAKVLGDRIADLVDDGSRRTAIPVVLLTQ